MDGLHQQCNGREFRQTLGDGEEEAWRAAVHEDDRVGPLTAAEQEVKFLLSI